MNFLIRFGFNDFGESLAAGSTVFGIAYSEGAAEKAEAVVLLTSDGGRASGPILALRMSFEVNGGDALAVATDAFDRVKELMRLRGMTWSKGVLLTEGLNESIRDYTGTNPYTIKTVDEWLAKERSKDEEAEDK